MDVPVLSDVALTLRAPLGGSEGISTCSLGDRVFLVSSVPDVLHVMVVASEGIIEIVQTFDALPEKNIITSNSRNDSSEGEDCTEGGEESGNGDGVSSSDRLHRQRPTVCTVTDTSLAGVGQRASKMLFSKTENIVFILIGGCLRCFGYDPRRSNCFPAVILVDEDVIDFDIAFCPQLGLLVAALFEENIIQTWTVRGGLFLNLSQGEMPVDESETNYAKIQFVASPVVCAYDDREMAKTGYTIISVDTLTLIGHISVAPTPGAKLMATPLYDAMERANMLNTNTMATTACSTLTSFAGSPTQKLRPPMDTMYNFTTPNPAATSNSLGSNPDNNNSGGAFSEWDSAFGSWGVTNSLHSNKFAVLAFNPKQVLEFRLELYQLDPSFGMRHLMMVPLVCVAHPTFLSSIGPWLVVGLPYGVEYYDWQNGDFAQSALDSCAVVSSSLAARVADFNRTSASHLYTSPTNDIVFYVERDGGALAGSPVRRATTGPSSPSRGQSGIGGGAEGFLSGLGLVGGNGSPRRGGNSHSSAASTATSEGVGGGAAGHAPATSGNNAMTLMIAGGTIKISLVVTAPIVEVVYGLLERGAFQGLQPTDLMHYGHDIGAEAIVGGADFVARLAAVVDSAGENGNEMMKRNSLFNEYGAMLGKFVHLHREAGVSNCDGCKYCSLCGAKFGLFRSGRRCALCNSPCCEDCALKYDLRDYGFMNVDPDAPIFPCCSDCICYADQTLYLLMASKRYLQLLQYASDYPEKTCGFTFDFLLDIALNQCFLDKRYDICARIVIKYISQAEQLQEWIARFASAKQLHVLANVFDPRRNDSTLVTTIMMATMKSDPSRLRTLVRKWPSYCYDVSVVAVGIEQQLRKRRAECEMLQEQCETTPQNEDDRRAATGLLYIDADTTQLLLALLHIYGANEEHTNVVRAYIEHFDQFQMSKDERALCRPRADAVMVTGLDGGGGGGGVTFEDGATDDGSQHSGHVVGGLNVGVDPSTKKMSSPCFSSPSSATTFNRGGGAFRGPASASAFTQSPHTSSSRFVANAAATKETQQNSAAFFTIGSVKSPTFGVPKGRGVGFSPNVQQTSVSFWGWTEQRCMQLYVDAATSRKRNHRNAYDFQPLDVCEYIRERGLFPIALAPYGHTNNFIVMTTMVRLYSEEVADYLSSVSFDTCQSILDVMLQHLTQRPKEQLSILHALSQRSLSLTATYHDRLANLYIDLKPEMFLWFVKQKQVTNVDWRRVLLRVQQRRMYAEMVYVVGRIGNDKDAIRIAIRNLRSVHFAMKYVSDGAADDDQDSLWSELLGHVIQNSDLIGDCMDHIAEYRNPAEFLKMIPARNRVVIPNVGARLGKIRREQSIDKSIEDSCLDLFRRDNLELFKVNLNTKRRAIRVVGDASVAGSYRRCGICHTFIETRVARTSSGQDGGVVFAACGHAFHQECLCTRYDVTKYAQPVQIRLIDDEPMTPASYGGEGDAIGLGSGYSSPTSRRGRRKAIRGDGETRARTFTMSPAAAVGEDGDEYETREERDVRKATRMRAARRAMVNYSVLREQEDCRDIFQMLPNHLVVWILSYVPPASVNKMRNVAEHWRETIDVAKVQLATNATIAEDAPLDPKTHDLVLRARYLKSIPRTVPSYQNSVVGTTIELGSDLFVSNNSAVVFSPASPSGPSVTKGVASPISGGEGRHGAASCILCESSLTRL